MNDDVQNNRNNTNCFSVRLEKLLIRIENDASSPTSRSFQWGWNETRWKVWFFVWANRKCGTQHNLCVFYKRLVPMFEKETIVMKIQLRYCLGLPPNAGNNKTIYHTKRIAHSPCLSNYQKHQIWFTVLGLCRMLGNDVKCTFKLSSLVSIEQTTNRPRIL